jgi:ribosome-associated protein
VAIVLKKKQDADDKPYLANVRRMAALAADKKAEHIRAYDVQGETAVTDCFLNITVTSEPQMKAVMNNIREGMRDVGVRPLRIEGDFHGGWVLMDYNDIIVHLFRKEAREFYDLDGVWADAPAVELDLEDE